MHPLAAALLVVAALLLSAADAHSHEGLPPFAFTNSGLVVGLREGAAEKFLGIPFAAPPTGSDVRSRECASRRGKSGAEEERAG